MRCHLNRQMIGVVDKRQGRYVYMRKRWRCKRGGNGIGKGRLYRIQEMG